MRKAVKVGNVRYNKIPQLDFGAAMQVWVGRLFANVKCFVFVPLAQANSVVTFAKGLQLSFFINHLFSMTCLPRNSETGKYFCATEAIAVLCLFLSSRAATGS